MGKKYRVLSPVILNTSSDPARKQEQSYQPGAEVELDEKQAEQYLQQGWIEDADASQDQGEPEELADDLGAGGSGVDDPGLR